MVLMLTNFQQLKKLPQHQIEIRYPKWPRAVSVSGPLLKDILQETGWKGETIIVRGVDGYAPEFSRSDVESGQFVMALEAEGRPLSIGGRGPVWLVFPPHSYIDQDDSDSGLAWAVFNIEVR